MRPWSDAPIDPLTGSPSELWVGTYQDGAGAVPVSDDCASSVIAKRLALGTRLTERASQRLMASMTSPRQYVVYLLAMYGVIRASVPLMSLARRRSLDQARFAPYVQYLERHMKEEADHDEWLLQDLQSVPAYVPSDLPLGSQTIASMVGSQYYWINFATPLSLLGYMAILEGCPASAGRVLQIQEVTKLPEQAFRTLLEHAELDPDHAAELSQVIDRIEPDSRELAAICLSGLNTIRGLASVLSECVEYRSPEEAGGR